MILITKTSVRRDKGDTLSLLVQLLLKTLGTLCSPPARVCVCVCVCVCAFSVAKWRHHGLYYIG